MENLTPIQIAFFAWVLIVSISTLCTMYVIPRIGRKRSARSEILFTLSGIAAVCGWFAAWYGVFALAMSGTLS